MYYSRSENKNASRLCCCFTSNLRLLFSQYVRNIFCHVGTKLLFLLPMIYLDGKVLPFKFATGNSLVSMIA